MKCQRSTQHIIYYSRDGCASVEALLRLLYLHNVWTQDEYCTVMVVIFRGKECVKMAMVRMEYSLGALQQRVFIEEPDGIFNSH